MHSLDATHINTCKKHVTTACKGQTLLFHSNTTTCAAGGHIGKTLAWKTLELAALAEVILPKCRALSRLRVAAWVDVCCVRLDVLGLSNQCSHHSYRAAMPTIPVPAPYRSKHVRLGAHSTPPRLWRIYESIPSSSSIRWNLTSAQNRLKIRLMELFDRHV